jgi:hypothetical protein
VSERKLVPPQYWAVWIALLGAALVVFYGVLTPFWMLVRAIAWVSEHPFLRRGNGRGGSAS